MADFASFIDEQDGLLAEPEKPDNSFGGFVDSMKAMTQQQAAQSLLVNQDTNPDQAARALQLSPIVGLPAPVVESDMAGFEAQAQMKAARDTLRKNPVLASWVAANPESARIAKDDFDNLSFLSKVTTALSTGSQLAAEQDALGRASNFRQAGNLAGIATPAADAEVKRAREAMTAIPELSGAYGGLQAGSGFVVATLQNFINGAVPGAAAGASVGLVGGPSAPVTVPGGALAGAVIGFNTDAALVAAGLAYDEMDQARDRTGQPLSELSKQVGSLFVGVGTYALNSVGVRAGGSVAKDAVQSLTREAVTEAMTRPTVQRALTDVSKAVVKGGVQGAAINGAMQLTFQAGQEIAKQLDGGDFATAFNDPDTRRQYINELADAAEMGALLFGGMHTVGAGVKFVGDAQRAQQAKIDVQNFQSLMDGVAQSKTFQRSPDTAIDFLRSQLDGTPAENVFIPGSKVIELYQSAGIEPGAGDGLLGFVDDIDDQMRQAAATGGDVVIPAAEFQRLVGTDIGNQLIEDVRVRQDAMTLREAVEFEKNYERLIEENVVEFKAMAEQQASAGAATQQVFDDIFSKLRLAGQTADVARQNASLIAARYTTRAERNEGAFGDALGEYQREGLDVRRELPEAVKYIPVDQTDLILNALRNNRKLPSDKELFGPSLVEFLKKRGGIEDAGGELKAMDAQKVRGLVRKAKADKGDALPGMKAEGGGKFSLDDAALAAWEEGYFSELGDRPDINTFLEAVRSELSGQKRYIERDIDQQRLALRDAVDQWDEALSRLGLDVKQLDNQQIKAAIEEYQRGVQGDEFNQGKLTLDWTPGSGGKVAKIGDTEITYGVSRDGETAEVILVKTPKNKRGEGSARAAMQQFLREADAQGLTVFLTAEPMDKGVSKGGLKEFYKSLGFVDNTGRNKDFRAMAGMVRQPKPAEFNQSERGKITIGDGQNIITLFKDADTSTFLHETGHKFLDELVRDGLREGAPEGLRNDLGAVMKWLGVDKPEDIGTTQHEQFARGFEAYLLEGKAPSTALASAFQKFKAWLIGIYRQVANLNVPINDDIRGVMDRLIATDEEIARARDIAGANPLFKSAEDAGMTQAEFAAYTAGMAKERVAASDRLLKRVMKDIRRQRTEEWKNEYAAMREDVERETRSRNDLRAQAWLRNGRDITQPDAELGEHVKLAKDELVAMYANDEVLRALPKGVYAVKDGVHPDALAEQFGYRSGDEMVRALMSLEAQRKAASEQKGKNLSADSFMRKLIDDETQSRMEERHGDMLKDGSIEEEALAAIHSDGQAAVMSTELRSLARMIGGEPPLTVQMIREWASGQVAAMPIKRVANTGQFARAELAGARDAQRALLKGDHTAAFEAKQRQLINHLMFKAATEAAEDYEKGQRQFRRYARNKTLASMDQDYLDQIHGLLERVGYATKRDEGDLARSLENASLADFLAAKEAEGQELVIPSFLLDAGYNKPIDQMTVDEFRSVKDAITSLAHAGRDSKTMTIEGEKIAMQELLDEMRDTLGGRAKEQTQGVAQAVTRAEKWKIDYQGILASLSTVEPWALRMDGGNRNGVFTRTIVRPVFEATARYRSAQMDTLAKFRDIVAPRKEELLRGKIAAPELGYTFTNKGELLHAIGHTGNESNMHKLLLGRRWGNPTENGVDRSRWDAMIARMAGDGTLTKADFDMVQQIWDLMESLKDGAQKAHREMYGVHFDEVTTRALQTPFGEYRGGYLPAITDRFMVDDGQARRDGEALKEQQNGAMFPTTGRGFTRARVEQYTKPLELNLALLTSHIDSVLRFSHLQPVIRNAGKLMLNSKFRSMMNGVDQAAINSMLVPWLQRTARQSLETPSMGVDGRAGDRLLRALRRNSGMQMMAGNIINAAQNLTGIAPGILKSSPGLAMRSLTSFVRSPAAMVEEIGARSAYMSARMKDQSYDMVREIETSLTKGGLLADAQSWAERHSYLMQRVVQHVSDVTVWKAAYESEIAKGVSDADAVYAADAAVRETQGGFRPEEVSKFMTGSPLKRIFAHMYGYFNTQANLIATELTLAKAMGGKEKWKRYGAIYLFGFAAPAILADAIMKTTTGGFGDWDEDDALADDMAGLLLGSQVKYISGMIPIAGPVIASIASDAPGDRIGSSPTAATVKQATRAFDSVPNAIVGEGKVSTAIKDTLTALGLVTGLPLAQLGKPLGYVADVATGEAEPEGASDVARGLVSGRQAR